MGLMAFLPMLALYIKERFRIEDEKELLFLASVIYGAAPFAAAIAGPIWGALGDRAGKKPMAMRANIAIALTTAMMPLMPTPVALLAMRVLQGVLAGYVAPAMALVSQHVAAEQQGAVIAKLQVAMATGTFVGPYLGAEVTHWFGRSAIFWVASVLSLAAAVLLHVFAHEERPVAPPGQGSFVGDLWRASIGLVKQPVFGGLLGLLLLLRLGQNMLEPLLAVFVTRLGPLAMIAEHSETHALAIDRTVAVAMGMLAIGQWVCTPIWGRHADRYGPLRCLALLALGLCGLFVAMTQIATTAQFLGLRAVFACLMAGSMTLAYAAASKRVAVANRTLAFAMVQSCIQFGLAIGPLIGAAVAGRGQATEFAHLFATAAALCGAAGLGMLVLRRATASAAGSAAPRRDA